MKCWKENRPLSFVLVAIVYLIASAVGIVSYRLFSVPWWLALLLADVIATVVTFAFSIGFRNASVYDPYWSVQPLVIVTCFALQKELDLLRWLLILCVWLWGVRLTANWAYTFSGLHCQDWRYTMLQQRTGAFYPLINFIGIHMVPTLVVYACVLPVVFALQSETAFSLLSLPGILISLIAVLLQLVSDIQMQRYRRQRTAPFIRIGLWKYARHPNYLGEILMWWGIAIAVVAAYPHAWMLLLGAVLNTLLFLCVSVPMAERRQSAKEGYQQYRLETRVFLPIPKR